MIRKALVLAWWLGVALIPVRASASIPCDVWCWLEAEGCFEGAILERSTCLESCFDPNITPPQFQPGCIFGCENAYTQHRLACFREHNECRRCCLINSAP